MKLLIVDDEVRTVNGLKNCLNWSELGIDGIETASNGAVALKVMEKFHADIVLTDIGMPKIGGLELSAELRRLYPQTHVVFITGYADVNNMKSAFKMQVVDYILKPIDVRELRGTMERIIRTISAERQRAGYLREIEEHLYLSLPLLREKFFLGLINNDYNPQTVEQKLKFLGLGLTENAGYAAFVLLPDRQEEGEWQQDQSLLSVAIINIVQEILSTHTVGYCIEKSENHFVIILSLAPLRDRAASEEDSPPDMEELLEQVARETREILNQYLEIHVTIGIGVWVERLSDISLSYQTAQQAAARRLYLGHNQIILGGAAGIHQENHVHVNFNHYNRIYTAVVNSDSKEALAVVDEIFQMILSGQTYKRAQVLTVCNQIVSAVNSALTESVDCADAEIERSYAEMAALLEDATVEELHRLMRENVGKSVQCILSESMTVSNSVINTVKTIVNEQYGEDISLRTIAKEVFLSPAYLCLLFKQETGQTLTNYITTVRVENAKRLMRNKNRKLIDICYEVGFHDSKYFSRIFKKYTGENPSEFRASQTE